MPDPERRSTSHEQYQELLARYLVMVDKYRETFQGTAHRARLGDLVLQHTPDGIALFRDGKVVSCNRPLHSLCTMQALWRRGGPSNRDERAPLQAVLARSAQEQIDQGLERATFCVRPSNAPNPVLEVSAYLVEERGQTSQVALILRDRTESEHWAEELRGSERRDEFLATLAHELRNPLTPIVGAAEYLLHTSSDPAVRRFSEIILRQARHQSRMIEDLLDIARVREGKLRLEISPVDLCEVVRDAVEATEARRAGGPSLKLTLPEGCVWVDGDATRLVQVVTNLLNNAAKFTPSDGSNWLELNSGEGIAWLCVRDSGEGIAPEMISQVWQTFVQAERPATQSQSGLGIGLSLVKSVVELHGGGVRGVSEGVGRGAEFTIWLPLRGAPVPSTVRHNPRPEQSVSLRILVVEDNPDARETIQELLAAHGHQVITAGSFSDAVRSALEVRPNVILSDLRLPDQDGILLAESLRHLLPTAVFIAMSGHFSAEAEDRARSAGFTTCLHKPLEPESLLQALNRSAR